MIKDFYKFAHAIAAAMNSAGVSPPEGEIHGAVLVLVHGANSEEQPIGGSLNWAKERRVWEVDVDLQHAQRVVDEERHDERH
jgi:hypothetical protein